MAELEDEAVQLTIDIATAPGQPPVVQLSGELDSSNVERLRETLNEILAGEPEQVIFDMRALQFMDSAGISVLVRTAAAVESVQIRDPSPIVRRVIEITGLTGLLQVEP
jgi:anti-sigma B factor antagonist